MQNSIWVDKSFSKKVILERYLYQHDFHNHNLYLYGQVAFFKYLILKISRSLTFNLIDKAQYDYKGSIDLLGKRPPADLDDFFEFFQRSVDPLPLA